jgi:hypothetical protein
MKKRKKREKRSKINLILSHVNCTWTLKLDPTPLDTLIIPQENLFFCDVKKGPIQGSICFKLVPGFWVPEPLSKVALSVIEFTNVKTDLSS